MLQPPTAAKNNLNHHHHGPSRVLLDSANADLLLNKWMRLEVLHRLLHLRRCVHLPSKIPDHWPLTISGFFNFSRRHHPLRLHQRRHQANHHHDLPNENAVLPVLYGMGHLFRYADVQLHEAGIGGSDADFLRGCKCRLTGGETVRWVSGEDDMM